MLKIQDLRLETALDKQESLSGHVKIILPLSGSQLRVPVMAELLL